MGRARPCAQDSNVYTVHSLVFTVLVQSPRGQAPRNGIHFQVLLSPSVLYPPSPSPLSLPVFG